MSSVARSYPELKRTLRARWWHDSLIDFILANPTATQAEIGAAFNRSATTISLVTNSDVFKARFDQRRSEHSARVHASIVTKLSENLNKSLDIMHEVLEKKRDAIPFQQLLEFQDKTLQRLGYGVAAPAVVVNNTASSTTLVSVPAEALREAREAIRRSEQAKLLTLEAMPAEEVSESGLAVEEAPQPEAPDDVSEEPVDGFDLS